jgi:hypothetical protein
MHNNAGLFCALQPVVSGASVAAAAAAAVALLQEWTPTPL